MALSFDDAPTGPSTLMTGWRRTSLLIDSLSRCDLHGAIFFVTSSGLTTEPEGALRLNRYAQAGHTLANHGHAHLALSNTSLSDYLADLDRAENILRSFRNVAPLFRYPYLDEGANRATHLEISGALAERGLRKGHVTVATYDFYLQLLLDEALASRTRVDLTSIRELYIELVTGCVEFYDALARKVVGRSPVHVLLLHENDLAALFVSDLVVALTARGWEFVPALEAYKDPLYLSDPETTFRNQGLVAAIAHATGQRRSDLVPIEEEESYISTRFETCKAGCSSGARSIVCE